MASKKPSLDNDVGKKSPDGFFTFSQTTTATGNLGYEAVPFQLPTSLAPSPHLQSSLASTHSSSARLPSPLPPVQSQDIISPPLPNRATRFTRHGPFVAQAKTHKLKSPPTSDQDKKRAAAPASSVVSKYWPNPYKKSRSVAGSASMAATAPEASTTNDLSTRKEMFTRKKMISTRDMTSVEDYDGNNSSLVENHFCFSPQTAMFALTQPGSTLETSPTRHAMAIAAAASSLSGMTPHQLGIVDIPTDDMLCQPVSGEDPLCQAIESIPVKLKTFYTCVHCNKRQAVTSRPAKEDDANKGPGSHPFDTCGSCAKSLGGVWLKDAAGCFCGAERFNSTYVDCKTCRKKGPCKLDGCVSQGEVNPNSQMCNEHHNEYYVRIQNEKKKVPNCRRCGNLLYKNRRINGSGGAVKNICSNSPCVDLCAFEYDKGVFCQEERGNGVFCPKHSEETESKRCKDYRQKKNNGTFKYKHFQPEEWAYLEKLTSDPDNLRKDGKINWKEVVRKFKEEFDGHEKYEERTADQIERKHKTEKRKKNGKSNCSGAENLGVAGRNCKAVSKKAAETKRKKNPVYNHFTETQSGWSCNYCTVVLTRCDSLKTHLLLNCKSCPSKIKVDLKNAKMPSRWS